MCPFSGQKVIPNSVPFLDFQSTTNDSLYQRKHWLFVSMWSISTKDDGLFAQFEYFGGPGTCRQLLRLACSRSRWSQVSRRACTPERHILYLAWHVQLQASSRGASKEPQIGPLHIPQAPKEVFLTYLELRVGLTSISFRFLHTQIFGILLIQ